MDLNLRGTGTALVTPFTGTGDIDFEALGRIIEYNIKGGVEFLVCLGTTGEAVTLSRNECQQIFDFTVEKVANRVPIVFGVFGSNDTGTILERFKAYNSEGATALLSASPYYNKPTQAGIIAHYKRISEESPLPIILYNVPGRTASNMTAETTLQIAEECENVIGMKEASGDLVQISEIIKHRPDNFMLWSGDDPTAYATTALGGDGIISVISNAFPYEFSAMIRKVFDGKLDMALKLHHLLLDLHKWLYIEGNPVGIKAATERLGFGGRHVRLPLLSMSDDNVTKLVREIEQVIDKSSYSSYYS